MPINRFRRPLYWPRPLHRASAAGRLRGRWRKKSRYHDADVTIDGIVAISASPSGGVHRMFDIERAFETVAGARCPY
jgi:hypothetical protein